MSARNGCHFGFIAVPGQQGFTERIKVRVRETVVLEDDPLCHMLEEPRDGSAVGSSATEIGITEKRHNLARPVDRGCDLPGLTDQLGLALPIRTGAIPCNKETGGLNRANAFKNARCLFRAI